MVRRCMRMHRIMMSIQHRQRGAIKRHEHDDETLREITRGYNVHNNTSSRRPIEEDWS
jgi:hypothetical protein